MDINKPAVGQRIKNIRQSKGMTMEEFGKLVDGAQKSNVSKWENGKSLPSNKRLKLIADIGNISTYDILFGISSDVIDMGLSIYDTNLKQSAPDSHTGKAYRFFDDSDKLNIILDSFTEASDANLWGNSKEEINTALFAMIIDKNVLKRYEKKEKSNENAILLVKNALENSLQSLEGYDETGEGPIEKLVGNPLNRYYMRIDKEYDSVSTDLILKLQQLIEEFNKKLETLIEEFPDRESKIIDDVFFAPYNKKDGISKNVINFRVSSDGRFNVTLNQLTEKELQRAFKEYKRIKNSQHNSD